MIPNITETENAIYLKDRVARLSNIFVSGIMNSIDNDALGRAISIVRGVLNIGLESCLVNPTDYGLEFDKNTTDIDKSITCIHLLIYQDEKNHICARQR